MQFLDCKITLSFSNQKIKDRSETLINKGIYEVKLKFIASLIVWKHFIIFALNVKLKDPIGKLVCEYDNQKTVQ